MERNFGIFSFSALAHIVHIVEFVTACWNTHTHAQVLQKRSHSKECKVRILVVGAREMENIEIPRMSTLIVLAAKMSEVL